MHEGAVSTRLGLPGIPATAETVAVACPYCAIMLDDAAGHANRKDVQIVDIAELLASRLTG